MTLTSHSNNNLTDNTTTLPAKLSLETDLRDRIELLENDRATLDKMVVMRDQRIYELEATLAVANRLIAVLRGECER